MSASASTDISDYKEVSDIPLLFFAILTIDVTVLFLTRYFPGFFGKPLNDWYTKFGLAAVLSDVLVILIGFLIARYLYTWYFKAEYGWNPLTFAGLLVAVQAVHDFLFYIGVILPIPKGHNDMMDVFKAYAASAGGKIIGGDALLMLGSLGVALWFKTQPSHIVASVSVLVSYALTYILFTKPHL
jgi:hypothetical protein